MTTPTSLRARCPYCGTVVLPAKPPASRPPFFPFCSSRCKMADLQRWFKGSYVISQDIETLTPDQRQEIEELEDPGTAVGEPK